MNSQMNTFNQTSLSNNTSNLEWKWSCLNELDKFTDGQTQIKSAKFLQSIIRGKLNKNADMMAISFITNPQKPDINTGIQKAWRVHKTPHLKPNHWNNFHSQKVNGSFGRDSYAHSLKYNCGVVSVGVDPDMTINSNKQIKTFCKNALPGDLVYMNGFLGIKKSKDKATVSHCGVWTGRVLTPNLSHPVIKHLIEEHGCNFVEGEIGSGLTHVHNPTATPIYIELTDFRELPGPHIMGPGRPGTMLYKLLSGQKNRHGQPFPFA